MRYPKISIITPTYNQGKFIRQTIDSILGQDYPNVEHIIVDGGSTDDTLDILDSYGDKISWLSEKDNGQAHAINKGMKIATGEIVAFLNSDDYYLPGTLRYVAQYFEQNPTGMWVTGDYKIINETGKSIQHSIVLYKSLFRFFSSYPILSIINYIVQPSTFWKKDVFDEIGYFDESLRYAIDYDFWMRLMKKYPHGTIWKPLSVFRIHRASKGGSEYYSQFDEELKVLERYQDSKTLIQAHRLHNKLITTSYRIIK